jgi:hypothetical protein
MSFLSLMGPCGHGHASSTFLPQSRHPSYLRVWWVFLNPQGYYHYYR